MRISKIDDVTTTTVRCTTPIEVCIILFYITYISLHCVMHDATILIIYIMATILIYYRINLCKLTETL